MRAHLARPGEPALERGYELGRRALEQGLGVVELGALYQRILAAELRPHCKECAATVRSLESFFVESLSPYEMTHRGYREAHTALRYLNELLEEEARRIAHALHDESAQLLVSVHLALAELGQTLPSGHEAQVEKMRAALDEVEEQLRRLSHELRPPILDDLGLMPALRALAEGFSRRSGLKIKISGNATGRLSSPVEVGLYRVVMEALNNVHKHAQASQVTVRLKQQSETTLQCSIRDDGAGFDVRRVLASRKTGLGLRGIQERLRALDARLEIRSRPGNGTELLIEVLLKS